MSIITLPYFRDEIMLPNISQLTVSELVTQYITTYETQFLQKVLGYSLAKDFIVGLAVMPTPAQKWLDLRDGKEFTDPDTSTLTKWIGWKDLTTYQSAIAYYVYYKIRKDTTIFTTASGDAASTHENSFNVGSGRKMAFAWNQMCDWNYLVWQYLWVNKSTYDLESSDFGSFWHNRGIQYFLKNADYLNMCNSINNFDL